MILRAVLAAIASGRLAHTEGCQQHRGQRDPPRTHQDADGLTQTGGLRFKQARRSKQHRNETDKAGLEPKGKLDKRGCFPMRPETRAGRSGGMLGPRYCDKTVLGQPQVLKNHRY